MDEVEVMEKSVRQVGELLEAHAEKKEQATSETFHGLVTVTVDARLQLTSVKLHDKLMGEARRAELESAIVAAVNAVRFKALKAVGESLSALRESPEWKRAMGQIFRRSDGAS